MTPALGNPPLCPSHEVEMDGARQDNEADAAQAVDSSVGAARKPLAGQRSGRRSETTTSQSSVLQLPSGVCVPPGEPELYDSRARGGRRHFGYRMPLRQSARSPRLGLCQRPLGTKVTVQGL